MSTLSIDAIWRALEEVKDPEIPVVSVVELGVVRDVTQEGDRVIITMTPTFSGCPALDIMRTQMTERILAMGVAHVEVKVVLAPAWSTDWITEEARAKLRSFGLAPPPHHDGDLSLLLLDQAECPYCGSQNTSMRNSFGPTLCRMIFYCNSCQQPFEQFKPL